MLRRTAAFLSIAAAAAFAQAQERQPDQAKNPPQPPVAQQPQAQENAGQAQRQQRQAQPGQARKEGQTAAKEGDFQTHMADCLILGNKEEIALLQFGIERTQNEQVKQLAEKMLKDHQQAVQKLSKFAGKANDVELAATGPGSEGRGGAKRREALRVGTEPADANRNQAAERDSNASRDPAARRTDDAAGGLPAERGPGARPAGQGSQEDQMFQIAKEISENCLQLAQQDLAKFQGQDFDVNFLGYQAGLHNAALAKLRAFEGHVSGEFAQVLQEAQQTTEEHKQHLVDLKQQLSGSGERGAAAGEKRPATQPQRTNPNQPAPGQPAPTQPKPNQPNQ